MKKGLIVGALLAGVSLPASAATIVVFAQENSSSGGVAALPGLVLTTGDTLTVTSSTNDLWSAGALPRYSDASGLTGNRFATAADDSGQAPGTLIGTDFGLWTQDGFSAPYGSLVGRINGVYKLLGANFAGPAWTSGALELYYWDSNNGDNFGSITFDVNAAAAVPEPSTWALLILGFGMVGVGLRSARRTSAAIRFA